MHEYPPTTRYLNRAVAIAKAAALIGARSQDPVAARTDASIITSRQLLPASISVCGTNASPQR